MVVFLFPRCLRVRVRQCGEQCMAVALWFSELAFKRRSLELTTLARLHALATTIVPGALIALGFRLHSLFQVLLPRWFGAPPPPLPPRFFLLPRPSLRAGFPP